MSSQASLIPQQSARKSIGSVANGNDRWQFLAETSLLLGAAGDLEEVLATALRAAVPRFADVCIIRLHGDRAPRPLPVGFARPELMEAFSRIRPREESADGAGRLDLKRRFGLALLTEMNEDTLRRIARDAANLSQWKELAPTTAITVPITFRGRSFGRVHFLTTQSSGQRYHLRDVALARDFTLRLASAVDGAVREERLRLTVASMRANERE